MLARHAVEELLETGCLQARTRVARTHVLEAAHVVEQGGEEVHARGQLAALQQGCVHVVPDEVEPRMGHERHVAYAGHAVLGQPREEAAVSVGHLLVGERPHDLRHQLHGGRLAHDAGQLACLVAVVGAACRRHAVAREPQLVERGRVQPQRVRVSRVQRHGTRGERFVQRALRRQHWRVPAVFAPSLC